MKKKLIKIASAVFALSMTVAIGLSALGSSLTPQGEIASAATTRTQVTGNTVYNDDIEWLEIDDTIDSATISDDWKESTGVTSIQTPNLLKYELGYCESLMSYNPYTHTDYALVVNFDMMLLNVYTANFSFVYGVDTQNAATLNRLEGNSFSFYGENSLFFSTLENDSRIYQGDGTYPPHHRWLDWKRSGDTTIIIHPDGSQELYQDGDLIAYVTVNQIQDMSDKVYKLEYADAIDEGATEDDAIATATAAKARFLERSTDTAGYCGFIFRPNEGDTDDDTVDFTTQGIYVGFVNESWFTKNKSYTEVEDVDADGNAIVREVLNTYSEKMSSGLEDEDCPMHLATERESAPNVWWRIKDNTPGTNYFQTFDENGEETTANQVGWVAATEGDYTYCATGASSLVSNLELSNNDARLGGERYAMLRMRTWLGGLEHGRLVVTMGNYKVVIGIYTLDNVTRPFLRVYDGEIEDDLDANTLVNYGTGLTYVPLRVYDDALLCISLWGDKDISVSYGKDGDLTEFTFASKYETSGQSKGNLMIETTAGTLRCLYDDISVYTFEPYEGEDFTDGDYDETRLTINDPDATTGDGALVNSTDAEDMIHFKTTTTEQAIILSPNTYDNFTLEFDSPNRGTDWLEDESYSSWIGIVFGMENTTDRYSSTNVCFMYINVWGAIYFGYGTPSDLTTGSLILDEDAGDGSTRTNAPLILPELREVETDVYAYPQLLPWHPDSYTTSTQQGCAYTNLHIKIIVYENVVYVYHQLDGYEQVKVMQSVTLGTDGLGNDATLGYVQMRSTSGADFTIDNIKLTEFQSDSDGVLRDLKAINTFYDIDGNLWEATASTYSASAAEADWISASEIFPISYPELDGYLFVGWMDMVSGSLIGVNETFANFGGRKMTPLYVSAHSNSMTTDSEVTIDFYLEYKSSLTGRGNRLVVEFFEYDSPDGGNVVNTTQQISTDGVGRYVEMSDGATAYKFTYAQAPKDYLNQVQMQVRTGGNTWYDVPTKSDTYPWQNYSLNTYLTKVAAVAESITDEDQKAAYEQYACQMAVFCDSARQYFDSSYTEISSANTVEGTHANIHVETFDAVMQKTSDEFADYALKTSGTKPDGLRLMGFTTVFELGFTLRLNFQIYSGTTLTYEWADANGEVLSTVADSSIGSRYNEDGDKYYYIELPKTAAYDLNATHYLKITDQDGTSITLGMSVLTYAYMANVQKPDTKIADFTKTLLLYQQTAWDYFDYVNGNN